LLRIRRIVDRKSDVITKNLNSDVVTSWDSVRESFRAIGIVRAVTFAGVYRYLVEFEDSRTNTFFGFELGLAQKPSVARQPEAT